MRGLITRIELQRIGSNDERYFTVHFKLTGLGLTAKTYLCSNYENYDHWKDAIMRGTLLDNLCYKHGREREGLLDADVPPRIISKPPQQQDLL
jgi:hypothetical protein